MNKHFNDKHFNENHMTEKQLDRVLRLFESGASADAIAAKFPRRHQEEIFDVLRAVSSLERDRKQIEPPPELLETIINSVTPPRRVRYPYRGDSSSIINSLVYAFRSVTLHSRIAVPAVVAVVLVMLFVTNRPDAPTTRVSMDERSNTLMQYGGEAASGTQEDAMAPSNDSLSSSPESLRALHALPPATGNADDTVAAFKESFKDEESVVSGGDSQIASFVTDDGASAYDNFYEEDF